MRVRTQYERELTLSWLERYIGLFIYASSIGYLGYARSGSRLVSPNLSHIRCSILYLCVAVAICFEFHYRPGILQHTRMLSDTLEESGVEGELPAWQTTLDQIRLANAQLQRRLADAEKDRELFRDLYAKASSHTGDITRENAELLERATLAEGQVRDGLRIVEGNCAERVRVLEMEVVRWKTTCELLSEKDRRTDDEVRRRAALEPELRAENGQLRERLDAITLDYQNMEKTLGILARQGSEQNKELVVPDALARGAVTVSA